MIDLDTMSVLIVDDMESMRKSIRGMLKVLQLGKTIRLGSNGREGWELLNSAHVDLAIIDWNMPIMKGIEFLGLIRDSKKYRDMPVIMITAEAEKEIVAEAAESDIDGYLLKPLTTQSLDERIRSVINLANNPEPATIHLKNGRSMEEAGDIPGAIEEVKKALKERPTSSRILRKLGQLYSLQGNDEIAEKCLSKAVAINKNDAMSRYILGELYLKKDDLTNAVKYYDQAISISPRNISKGIDLGDVLMKRGMATQAVDIFSKVIKYSGKGLMHSEQVAELCIENNEYNYAKMLLESIIKENPERYDLVFKLGTLYENTGDADTALSYFITVDENLPEDIDSKLHIAKIYLLKKKVFVADNYLNKILKIDPKHEETLKLRMSNY